MQRLSHLIVYQRFRIHAQRRKFISIEHILLPVMGLQGACGSLPGEMPRVDKLPQKGGRSRGRGKKQKQKLQEVAATKLLDARSAR